MERAPGLDCYWGRSRGPTPWSRILADSGLPPADVVVVDVGTALVLLALPSVRRLDLPPLLAISRRRSGSIAANPRFAVLFSAMVCSLSALGVSVPKLTGTVLITYAYQDIASVNDLTAVCVSIWQTHCAGSNPCLVSAGLFESGFYTFKCLFGQAKR